MWSFWDIISTSDVLFVFFAPLYKYITTYNPIHLVAFTGIQLLSISIELTKQYILPSCSRPKGAKGCDILNQNEDDNGKPGMPSGHSASIAFYGAFYDITDPLFLLFVALVAMSRYFKKCHSIAQIIVGLSIGAGLGYGLSKLYKLV
jgi:membrane-associated phospholipid phosphatase